MKTCKLLFLAANPSGTSPLALDEESREIEQKIRGSEYRDSLTLVSKWAIRPDDLIQFLNQYRPHIVHFSGHGNKTEEIVLQDSSQEAKPVSKEALRALFTTLKDNVRVVVLNACYSRPQAQAITEVIDCAIGMNRSIGDKAAIAFAAAFYRAVAFGRSVQEAYDQGRTALLLEGIPEETTPELLVRNGVAASSIYLIDAETDGREHALNAEPVGRQSSPPSPLRHLTGLVDPSRSSTTRVGTDERIELHRFKPLKVLGETEHSTIQTCLYEGRTVVLKRTRAHLCDVEALRALIGATNDPLGGWSELVRSLVAAPRAAWVQDGFMWEVQDLYEGVSLGALVLRHQHTIRGPFLRVCITSLVGTLQALSETGLIHRDISPFNLLMTPSGELRLIDWTFCSQVSRRSVPVVTAGYTAPEQESGNASAASDWYALGGTLYFLGNGFTPPAHGTSEFDNGVRNLHAGNERLEYLIGDDWEVSVSKLCAGLLEPDPNARSIPTQIGWTPITQEFPQAPFPSLSIFQLGKNSHFMVSNNHYWILPRDLEEVAAALARSPNAEVEALVRRYAASEPG